MNGGRRTMSDRTPTIHVPIPSREGAESKGRRYLLEGRLRILSVHHGRVIASCRGSDREYHCGWVKGRWWCECEAKGRCSHLVALQMVVTAPRPNA